MQDVRRGDETDSGGRSKSERGVLPVQWRPNQKSKPPWNRSEGTNASLLYFFSTRGRRGTTQNVPEARSKEMEKGGEGLLRRYEGRSVEERAGEGFWAAILTWAAVMPSSYGRGPPRGRLNMCGPAERFPKFPDVWVRKREGPPPSFMAPPFLVSSFSFLFLCCLF